MENPTPAPIARTRKASPANTDIPARELVKPATWTPSASSLGAVKVDGIIFRSDRPLSQAHEAEINAAIDTIIASK